MEGYSSKLDKRVNGGSGGPDAENRETNSSTSSSEGDPEKGMTKGLTGQGQTANGTSEEGWKESQFAIGKGEDTWSMVLKNGGMKPLLPCSEDPETGSRCCDDDGGGDCGCTTLSAIVCAKIGAGKVGNMAVLKEHVDKSTGDRKLDCVVGPFWPVLVFVTYPLIIIISGFCFLKILSTHSWFVVVGWVFATGAVCVALFYTGCRNPGILYRYRDPPGQSWIWSDQAQTYRPLGAVYDTECQCIVEEFDHVCPWTGTAIGKGNMPAFKFFVSGICALIVLDIILVVGAWTVR